ncbi:AMP-binding protein, partial [Streptomyces albidoflavus]|uniref:AMP-binding protein n=1 Tax=Streptomyces albidoflavus TaxID=1886 RepID=UPI003F4CD0A8
MSRHARQSADLARSATSGVSKGGRCGRRARTRERNRGDTALISYTSGTSGTPKGATNTHGNIT